MALLVGFPFDAPPDFVVKEIQMRRARIHVRGDMIMKILDLSQPGNVGAESC